MRGVLHLLYHSPAVELLGRVLLHFLWQGALAGLLLALALRRLRGARAETRYAVAAGALLTVALLPVLTACWLASATGVPAPGPGSAAGPPGLAWSQRLLPWLVLGWTAGATLLLLRLAFGWRLVRRFLREETRPAPPTLQALLDRLRRSMGLRRPVRLLVGRRAWGPLTHGWLRPVVVVPASCLAGLAPDHLEAILAHELAHVRRRDFLVNLLQSVVEALLFFHPVVWWISHRIRVERENCCDDAAVRTCGDALTYARALASLEEVRRVPLLGLAARGGTLMNRIRRLVDGRSRTAGRIPWSLSAVLALGVAVAAPLAATAQEPEPGRCPHCGAELRLRREAAEAPEAPGIRAERPPVLRLRPVAPVPPPPAAHPEAPHTEASPRGGARILEEIEFHLPEGAAGGWRLDLDGERLEQLKRQAEEARRLAEEIRERLRRQGGSPPFPPHGRSEAPCCPCKVHGAGVWIPREDDFRVPEVEAHPRLRDVRVLILGIDGGEEAAIRILTAPRRKGAPEGNLGRRQHDGDSGPHGGRPD